MSKENDIEQIKAIIGTMSQRFQGRGGDIRFAGIEEGVVKIAPGGFCWR
jgi:Fe-S cluster biogenesis protein NfuA